MLHVCVVAAAAADGCGIAAAELLGAVVAAAAPAVAAAHKAQCFRSP